jgi:Meiotically up-regulated gene 113
MAKKKLTLDDIFSDDDFGLLDSKAKTSTIKTDEDRLVDSFEEINVFFDKNKREPNKSSMSEYGLMAKLKNFRENGTQKKTLKPFDRHNLLGFVEMDKPTIDDILNEDDNFGLLDPDNDLDIFKFNHTPKPEDRAETDFVARRKAIKEKEFEQYETMFQKVHQEIKEGKRKIVVFKNVEQHLHKGQFYIVDGIMLFLENVIFERNQENLGENTLRRKDGRTKTIFENGTLSNMLFRSLGKSLYNNGKMITETNDSYNQELFVNTGLVQEEDLQTGWIYVLKSKSTNTEISSIKDLYKIGFASTSVDDRIKNAKNEATYLFADVKKIATYSCYNRNADKLESLLHRFFASVCLDIEFENENGQRINPREWFIVPFDIIEEAIHLILNGNIVNYEYDTVNKRIVLRNE